MAFNGNFGGDRKFSGDRTFNGFQGLPNLGGFDAAGNKKTDFTKEGGSQDQIEEVDGGVSLKNNSSTIAKRTTSAPLPPTYVKLTKVSAAKVSQRRDSTVSTGVQGPGRILETDDSPTGSVDTAINVSTGQGNKSTSQGNKSTAKHARVMSNESVRSNVDTVTEHLPFYGPAGIQSRRSSHTVQPAETSVNRPSAAKLTPHSVDAPEPSDIVDCDPKSHCDLARAFHHSATQGARDIATETARDIATKTSLDIATKTSRDVATKTSHDVATMTCRFITNRSMEEVRGIAAKSIEEVRNATSQSHNDMETGLQAFHTQTLAETRESNAEAANSAVQRAAEVSAEAANSAVHRAAEVAAQAANFAVQRAAEVAAEAANFAVQRAGEVAAEVSNFAAQRAAEVARNTATDIVRGVRTELANESKARHDEFTAMVNRALQNEAKEREEMNRTMAEQAERIRVHESQVSDLVSRLQQVEMYAIGKTSPVNNGAPFTTAPPQGQQPVFNSTAIGNNTRTLTTPTSFRQPNTSSAPTATPSFDTPTAFKFYATQAAGPSAAATYPLGGQQFVHRGRYGRTDGIIQATPPGFNMHGQASGSDATPNMIVNTPRGMVAMFDQKELRELVNSEHVKVEQFGRQYVTVPVSSKSHDLAIQDIVRLGKDHLDSWKMSKMMIEDKEWSLYLVIGIINREIVASVYDAPLLDRFPSKFSAEYAAACKEESRAQADVFGDCQNIPLREQLARNRARLADMIFAEPGFQKWAQDHAYKTAQNIITSIKPLIKPNEYNAAINALYTPVLEAIRITTRMRQQVSLFEINFYGYGCRWEPNIMVQRNPELAGQACDQQPPIYVARCTLAPYMGEKTFHGNRTVRKTVIKAEVILCDRKGNLR